MYERAIHSRDLATAARCLLAYQRGEDSPEALAGALLISADLIARLNPPK
ncbi:hypothetical protein [Meiothermus phage MMP7]|nr:hypothetical protein [Meiothermus phage MMP7]